MVSDLTNRNHVTEISAVGHVVSTLHRKGSCDKGSYDFTEIVKSHGLKQGTVCRIMRFISHCSLKLHIQF